MIVEKSKLSIGLENHLLHPSTCFQLHEDPFILLPDEILQILQICFLHFFQFPFPLRRFSSHFLLNQNNFLLQLTGNFFYLWFSQMMFMIQTLYLLGNHLLNHFFTLSFDPVLVYHLLLLLLTNLLFPSVIDKITSCECRDPSCREALSWMTWKSSIRSRNPTTEVILDSSLLQLSMNAFWELTFFKSLPSCVWNMTSRTGGTFSSLTWCHHFCFFFGLLMKICWLGFSHQWRLQWVRRKVFCFFAFFEVGLIEDERFR